MFQQEWFILATKQLANPNTCRQQPL